MKGLAVLALAAVPGAALAHPSGAAGFIHPFAGLDHLLAMLAVGLWAAQMGAHWRWILPSAFVIAMAAGAAWGAQPALVEPMIAASVLALGLLVAVRARLHAAGAATAAVFALFHGMAHAAEIPAGASPAGYFAGFILATALLHAAGVLVGRMPRARWLGVPVALSGAWLLSGAVL